MKPRKITKAIVCYLPEKANNYHFVIDQNGDIEHIYKNPYWSPISTQPDLEAIYIGVVKTEDAECISKQKSATESILGRFEGISVEINNLYSDDNKKSNRGAKKGKPINGDLSGDSATSID